MLSNPTTPDEVLKQALIAKSIADINLLGQDALYICSICGTPNSYFQWTCLGCSDKTGGDQDDQ